METVGLMFLACTMEQEATKKFPLSKLRMKISCGSEMFLKLKKFRKYYFSLLLGSKLCFRVALHVNEDTSPVNV